MMNKSFFSTLFLLVSISLCGQGIRIDESLNDWAGNEVLLHDDSGDNSVLDIECLGVSDDSDFVYIKLEFDKEILLQGNNHITLNIETDDHQLSFDLGEQKGTFTSGGLNMEVFHNNLGLISSPTVTSKEFEIQIRKRWFINNSFYTLDGDTEIWVSNAVSNQDQAPNNGESLSYTLRDSNPPNIPSYSLEKVEKTDFRFCSYNMLFDNLFNTGAGAAYRAILSTIDADIYNLQEIFDHSAAETESFFNSLDNSVNWHSMKVGPDIVLLSKYPISFVSTVANNGVFVVEHDDSDIMIINIHLPCCDRDRDREVEIDAILSFIRNAKSGLSSYDLKPGTPIIISGDANFVGNADQVTAFMTGNIFNNNTSGPDFQIDWDTDGLQDLKPFATGSNAIYTWYNANSVFSRGRLDYNFFSDYSLEALNSFVLDTERLSEDELDQYNLRRGYTLDASDHYPVVVDYKFKNIVATTKPNSPQTFRYYPNPANDKLQLEYNEEEVLEIKMFSSYGGFIQKITSKTLDVSNLPEGLYQIMFAQRDGTQLTKKLVIAR